MDQTGVVGMTHFSRSIVAVSCLSVAGPAVVLTSVVRVLKRRDFTVMSVGVGRWNTLIHVLAKMMCVVRKFYLKPHPALTGLAMRKQ